MISTGTAVALSLLTVNEMLPPSGTPKNEELAAIVKTERSCMKKRAREGYRE